METREKDNVTYYYNRERRLANASEQARFAATMLTRKRTGFFGTLVASASLKVMFVVMVLCVIASGLLYLSTGTRDKGSLAGYSVFLSALWFEGDVYISVNRSPGFLKPAPVPVQFSMLATVGREAVSFILPAAEASGKIKMPVREKPKLAAVIVSCGDEKLDLICPVK